MGSTGAVVIAEHAAALLVFVGEAGVVLCALGGSVVCFKSTFVCVCEHFERVFWFSSERRGYLISSVLCFERASVCVCERMRVCACMCMCM